jgi:hypothetical protein
VTIILGVPGEGITEPCRIFVLTNKRNIFTVDIDKHIVFEFDNKIRQIK